MNYPTLSDLNDPSLIPPPGSRSAPDVGPAAVMVSTGPDMKQVRKRYPGAAESSFFISTLVAPDSGGKGLSFAGPYVGAPYAVMLLESLIAKGARHIVVFGWCGAVSEDLEPGDLVIPDEAMADEGTSRHYMNAGEGFSSVAPSKDLTAAFENRLNHNKVSYKKGRIWTTDAIYRETRKKIDYFRHKGAKAVEMECSALFAAAAFRKVDVTALLVVSDDVGSDEWNPGFRKEAFKQARRTGIEAVIDFSRKLNENGS